MNKKLFNENMTREEALRILFTECDKKTKEEKDAILKEYSVVLPKIIEHELGGPPMLTSYQI